jgi:hypothetical protein
MDVPEKLSHVVEPSTACAAEQPPDEVEHPPYIVLIVAVLPSARLA